MALTLDLTGKAAVVTGASRGLGRAMAVALAGAGADLAVTSRRVQTLDGVCEDISRLGRKALPIELDVRREADIRRMADEAVSGLGGVDILVNNAGCIVRKDALELTWADWDAVLETNLKGAFFCAQALAPGMLDRGWGRIINIGSATCVFAYPQITSYCASRGGVMQLTRSLAAEWGPRGVTANVLAPGWFQTEQNRVLWQNPDWLAGLSRRVPVGRMGSPAELGPAVVYLASGASAYVNGELFLIDGGFTTGSMQSAPADAREEGDNA